ncbi:hypothetical protein L202_00904 [Cryptococcus amylolentus CBS 6039]|uniref:Uncharacterized protein n=1 Tax=Cryptococcus amylolentus CBS 6039 TaxID=1295533 RepID=A0A1E3I932_9TREE|nr:hypothetical protein L202_00904 [Cryptococcus amylolentus CBS 6039]ODN85077.1 hypothetical protein L202_00904 [Cryptococcus amylolentus CBS 6039]
MPDTSSFSGHTHDTRTARAATSTTSITGTGTVVKTVPVNLSRGTLDDAVSCIINDDPSFIENQIVAKTGDDGTGRGSIAYQAREEEG